MKFVLTGLSLMLTLLAFSQNASVPSIDSLQTRYNNGTRQSYKGYMAVGENGRRIPRREMRDQFTFSPDVLKEFDLYRKKRKTAIFTNVIGLFLYPLV